MVLDPDARSPKFLVAARRLVGDTDIACASESGQLEEELEGQEADSRRTTDEGAQIDSDRRRVAQDRCSMEGSRPAANLQTARVLSLAAAQLSECALSRPAASSSVRVFSEVSSRST